MKLSENAITEFCEIFAQEYGAALTRDEAEVTTRNLLTLYRSLYEWHYQRQQQEHRTVDQAP